MDITGDFSGKLAVAYQYWIEDELSSGNLTKSAAKFLDAGGNGLQDCLDNNEKISVGQVLAIASAIFELNVKFFNEGESQKVFFREEEKECDFAFMLSDNTAFILFKDKNLY